MPEASSRAVAIFTVWWTHQSCVTPEQQHTHRLCPDLFYFLIVLQPQVCEARKGIKAIKNCGMDHWPSPSITYFLFKDTKHKLILEAREPQAKHKNKKTQKAAPRGRVLHEVIRHQQAEKWETNTNRWLPQSMLQYKESSLCTVFPTHSTLYYVKSTVLNHAVYFIAWQKPG